MKNYVVAIVYPNLFHDIRLFKACASDEVKAVIYVLDINNIISGIEIYRKYTLKQIQSDLSHINILLNVIEV